MADIVDIIVTVDINDIVKAICKKAIGLNWSNLKNVGG